MKIEYYFYSGIAILTIGFVLLFKIFVPFDGIEFNGDSFRYYQSSLNILHSIQNFSFPETTFWPYGFPFFAGFLFLLTGPSFLAAQLIPILASFGLFILLFLIIKNSIVFNLNEQIALLISMLLTFFSGLILKYQIVIMSDLPALFWAALTIYFLMNYCEKRRPLLLILLSVSAALAIVTRYVYGLILIPVFFIFWSEKKSLKSFFIESFLFALFVLITATPQLILNLHSLDSSFHHPWIQNWSLSNFWILDRTSTDGHLEVYYPNFIYYLMYPFRFSEFTPIGFFIFFTGLFFSLKYNSTRLSKIMIVHFLVFYLFLSGIPIQNPRFTLSLYIPIFYFQFEFFRYGFKTNYRKLLLISMYFLIAVKMIFSIGYSVKSIKDKNEMFQTGKNILAHTGTNSLIITWDFYETYFIYFPDQRIVTIHGLTKEKAQILLNQNQNVFLVMDEVRLEKVWKGMEPDNTYKWLKQNYNFKSDTIYGKYTIWKFSQTSR